MDITEKVKSFYEKTPFPDYEQFEDVDSFIEKTRKGVFGELLNEQIPKDARILEVGCGTGQMANFLSYKRENVYATDLCISPLRLAEQFKRKENLKARFFQMDLFRPIFREESFDYLICNGVLHHTKNAYEGFRIISRLVKRGGYVIIGLYNKYGRFYNDIRRVIFRITGDRLKGLDPHLKEVGDTRQNAWFKDQYKHPHETKHTVGEVLRWFNTEAIEFINCIPPIKGKFSNDLFTPSSAGNKIDRFFAQANWLLDDIEGGFYIMIGRKK